MKKTTWMAVALIGMAAPAGAQGVVAARTPASALEVQTVENQATGFAYKASVQARITRGAPYSAETVSESIQVLSNGTRIARKTATRVYRDTEGRTRTEQLNDNGEVESVSISDPVQGASYVLNPATRVAYRTGIIVATPAGTMMAAVAPGSKGTITTTQTAEGNVAIEARGTGGGGGVVAGGFVARGRGSIVPDGGATTGVPQRGLVPTTAATMPGETTREDLGQQTIEGVPANGTRTTTVIPAGAIGNDRPIQIVSEQWFSADLKLLVLTKHSDPRVGDTTFRMTGIVRTNPPASLFEVPSDYKLEQSFIKRDWTR